jgi:protein-S-isoprenylcysteine O-methyltransferase Ste14
VSGRRRRLPTAHLLRNVPLPEPHLAGIAAWVGMQRLRPLPLPGPRPVHHLVGWTLVVAGGSLVARSVRAASRVHLAQPQRLVTTGVYARSRNPMYAGWALLHLGAGLIGGSAWFLGAFPAATWLVHRQVLREERTLGTAFGDEFARYQAAVPRYL